MNYSEANINDPSVGELSQADVLNHLQFSAQNMMWFCAEGKELLESPTPHNRLVWDKLFNRVYVLHRDFGHTRSIKELFVRVVDRGLADVAALAGDLAAVGQLSERSTCNWIQFLFGLVSPGRFCGIGGGICSEDKTRELQEKLAAVVVTVKSPGLVIQLVQIMAPGNDLVQRLLADHFSNW